MINRLLTYLRGSEDRPPPGSSTEPKWPLTEVLTAWSNDKRDVWTLEDACRGTFITGSNGSGKSTGPGKHLAERFLLHGFGGLVLCAKADEAAVWRQLAERTGRARSTLYFGSDPRWKLNFLQYEASREGGGGGLTENIVNLFCRVTDIVMQKSGARSNEEYWQRAMKQLIRNAIDLLLMAGRTVSLLEIAQIINSAPQTEAQATDKHWQQSSRLYSYLLAGQKAASANPANQNAYQLTGNFWLSEFPNLAAPTRSGVVSTFTTLADALLRDPFRDRFCTETTFVPEMLLQGALCVVDLDIKRFGEVGQYAQVLLKYLVQQAVERRRDLGQETARPIFIWADECQNFIIPYDAQFQATARSSRCCSVYISQNLPSLYAELGGESAAKSRVDSQLGNLVTKIICQQGDPVTNHWAAEMIGKTRQVLINYGNSQSGGLGTMPSRNSSSGASETIDYDCPPREFQLSRTGGQRHDYIVDAVIYGGGRIWSNGKTWIKTSFKQHIN
jgi:TraM recognition site of TraD and TraG